MARQRIRATIQAVTEDNVAYQKVAFVVNDKTIDTKTVGPEGGEVLSIGFDLQDNRDNTIIVLVTPVDTGGQVCPAPAITPKTYKGADTIPPETPPAPTFELEADSEEASAPAAGEEPSPASAPRR